jgi:hypothetical protein
MPHSNAPACARVHRADVLLIIQNRPGDEFRVTNAAVQQRILCRSVGGLGSKSVENLISARVVVRLFDNLS